MRKTNTGKVIAAIALAALAVGLLLALRKTRLTRSASSARDQARATAPATAEAPVTMPTTFPDQRIDAALGGFLEALSVKMALAQQPDGSGDIGKELAAGAGPRLEGGLERLLMDTHAARGDTQPVPPVTNAVPQGILSGRQVYMWIGPQHPVWPPDITIITEVEEGSANTWSFRQACPEYVYSGGVDRYGFDEPVTNFPTVPADSGTGADALLYGVGTNAAAAGYTFAVFKHYRVAKDGPMTIVLLGWPTAREAEEGVPLILRGLEAEALDQGRLVRSTPLREAVITNRLHASIEQRYLLFRRFGKYALCVVSDTRWKRNTVELLSGDPLIQLLCR